MRTTASTVAAALVLLGACFGTAQTQAAPVRLRVLGDADQVILDRLRGAAFNGTDLAVVTEPEPGVHLFSSGAHRAFGKKGGGPAELENPENVVWAGGRILVHDFRGGNGKIVSYDPSGRFVSARSTAACGLAAGLQVVGPDTLLAAVAFGQPRQAIIRLEGSRCDTIVRYTLPQQITLSAKGSPPLTVNSPFAAAVKWVALPGRRIAYWDATNPYLTILNMQGRTVGRMPLPRTRYRVGPADRELWISQEIPEAFMGQRVFEPLRRKAREEVAFPTHLPTVLGLMPDPQGGVWVRRTTSGTGQVWTLVESTGERVSFKLPPGRALLAVGQTELAVRARDELDVETVEIYRKPRA